LQRSWLLFHFDYPVVVVARLSTSVVEFSEWACTICGGALGAAETTIPGK